MIPRLALDTIRFGDAAYLWLLVLPASLLVLWGWRLWRRRRDIARFRGQRTVPVRERFSFAGDLGFWFFALLAAGIFLLHRRGQYTPKLLAFAYPLLPAISFLTSAAIALNQIWAAPRDSFIGLGLLIMGLPVYFFWAHRSTTQNAVRGPGTDANDRLS